MASIGFPRIPGPTTLHFKSGENQRIRMVVKYQDYKRYEGKSTIRFGDVIEDNKQPQAPPKK